MMVQNLYNQLMKKKMEEISNNKMTLKYYQEIKNNQVVQNYSIMYTIQNMKDKILQHNNNMKICLIMKMEIELSKKISENTVELRLSIFFFIIMKS